MLKICLALMLNPPRRVRAPREHIRRMPKPARFLALMSAANNRSGDDDSFARHAYGLLDNLYAAYNAPG